MSLNEAKIGHKLAYVKKKEEIEDVKIWWNG